MPPKPTLNWRPQAENDLLTLIGQVADDNPNAAADLLDEIETKAAKLTDHPKLYKLSTRVPGHRELVVRANYIVLYRESATQVEIVNVLHARQQWPV
jgi:toxin ParE1/3/4